MMNDELYFKYREMFGCRIAIDCFTSQLCLATPENKVYSVEKATEESLNNLMLESINAGKNLLLEKFMGERYTFAVKPGCDY